MSALDEQLKTRILNSIGHENATGSILWELDQIRVSLGGESGFDKAEENKQVDNVLQLLQRADERLDDLHDELKAAKIEVEFFKLKADEWERAYRRHMEGCPNGTD